MPFHVMFWIASSVALVRISRSRSPFATRTRFVASITRGSTVWMGSAEVSPSFSGPSLPTKTGWGAHSFC